jgi:hypothetical protein
LRFRFQRQHDTRKVQFIDIHFQDVHGSIHPLMSRVPLATVCCIPRVNVEQADPGNKGKRDPLVLK